MLVLGQQQIVPARHFLRQGSVAAIGMARDAREEAFVPALAKEPYEFPRAGDDDIAHPFVEGVPGIIDSEALSVA
jgi:hypothetical protein